MSEQELKPCPQCGYDNPGIYDYVIICPDCDYRLSGDSKQKMIEEWNAIYRKLDATKADKDLLFEAYVNGFAASSEGHNGQYPYGVDTDRTSYDEQDFHDLIEMRKSLRYGFEDWLESGDLERLRPLGIVARQEHKNKELRQRIIEMEKEL